MKKIIVIFCLYFCFSLSSIAHAEQGELLVFRIFDNSGNKDKVNVIMLSDGKNGMSFNIPGHSFEIYFKLLVDWKKVMVRVETTERFFGTLTADIDNDGFNVHDIIYRGQGNFEARTRFLGNDKWFLDRAIPISKESLVPLDLLIYGD